MKTTIKFIAPWVTAAAISGAAIGGALFVAPVASAATNVQTGTAGTDPLVPYGTAPAVPYQLGYVNPNHDEGNTSSGGVDLPF